MRTASLSFILLLLSSLYLQTQTLSLRSKQVSLALEKNTFNVLSAFGFPSGLIQTSLNSQDQAQKVADLFTYYIDGKVFSNTVSSLFDKNQQNNFLTYNQLKNALSSEGVQDNEIQHALNLISLNQDDLVNYSEFNSIANVIFNEALTAVTWVYITKNPVISPTDRVDLDSVEDAILTLFKKLEGTYPQPRCEEIEYLFAKADKDHDGKLDIQEFHYLLSIFLKYYQAGISSNEYAGLIFDDDFFDEALSTESSTSESDYPGHTETSSYSTETGSDVSDEETEGTETEVEKSDASVDEETETVDASGSFSPSVDDQTEATGDEPDDEVQSEPSDVAQEDEQTEETGDESDDEVQTEPSDVSQESDDEQTEETDDESDDEAQSEPSEVAQESDDEQTEETGDESDDEAQSEPSNVSQGPNNDQAQKTDDRSDEVQTKPNIISDESDREQTEETKKPKPEAKTETETEESDDSDDSDGSDDSDEKGSSKGKGNSKNKKKWNFSSSSSSKSHFSFGNKGKWSS